MKDPGLFSDPAFWLNQETIQNALRYVRRDRQPVGLVERGTSEVFAVIVPIEQYRRMTDASQ